MKEQLTLFDLQQYTTPPTINSAYDDSWDKPNSAINTVLEQTSDGCKPDSTVLEQATRDTNKSAPEQSHWVEKYTVTRYGTEHYYFRYLWMEGRKLHHIHIPGGNAKSAIALERKSQVEAAILDGQTVTEIRNLIRSWREEK
jgi:hypothetical protein